MAVATASVSWLDVEAISVTVPAAVVSAAVALAVVVAAVPFSMMAAALKVSNDFSMVGLMANTIPFPQCVPVRCLQYHHVGSVPVTVYSHVGAGTMVLFGFAMKPESGASAAFLLQGRAKVDSVTVWFCDINTNWTTSFTAATIWLGA